MASDRLAEAPPRVAMVCTGLGNVHRGYEASVLELYRELKPYGNFKLYSGRMGAFDDAIGLWNVRRQSRAYSAIPHWILNSYRRYTIECFTAGIALLLKLRREPVDIVFTPDHRLGDFLFSTRHLLPKRPKVIFSNGAPFDSAYCKKYDAVHQKSYSDYQSGVARFGDEMNSYLIPNGFNATRLKRPDSFDRRDVLSTYNLPTDAHIVLALSALQIHHKRLDWLFTEFARLPSDKFHLVVAGAETDESRQVRQVAERTLPHHNFTIMSVKYEKVPELIWCSDMMALCSLSEGFPRVVAEAMGAEKYIAVHPHENNQWILSNPECYVDMQVPGALSDRISLYCSRPGDFSQTIQDNRRRFLDRFSWDAVTNAYLQMFYEVVQPPKLNAVEV